MAFLPTGGIIDRLGDARERSRESLVILGGLAFRAGSGSSLAASKSGKMQETALQTFERLLKEIGLASKAWRIREQVRHELTTNIDYTCIILCKVHNGIKFA